QNAAPSTKDLLPLPLCLQDRLFSQELVEFVSEPFNLRARFLRSLRLRKREVDIWLECAVASMLKRDNRCAHGIDDPQLLPRGAVDRGVISEFGPEKPEMPSDRLLLRIEIGLERS